MSLFSAIELRGDWNPWRDLARVQREMDQIFQRAGRPAAEVDPPVDVWVGEDEATVRAELPGVAPDGIEISIEDDVLCLRGNRKVEAPAGEARWHLREREGGDFRRKLRLPFRIDSRAVAARFSDGILEVKLPRAEADKPRRIAVQAA